MPLGYSPYRVWPYYGAALGFGGLGLYFDPFLSGYGYGGYPGYYGGYPGYGYSGSGYGGYGNDYPYQNDLSTSGPGYSYTPAPPFGNGANSDSASGQASQGGHLRLLVEPATAQLFVDGFYVGTVGDFNGSAQDAGLEAGPHRIEIRAPGYDTLMFDVKTEANRTITYRGNLQPARQ